MKLTFTQRTDVGDDVTSFSFTPEQPVRWLAGQSIRIEIRQGYSTQERRFTISSAPFEKNITISTRLSNSSFKRALNALQPGDIVDGYNIEGSFTWTDESKNVLFIAWGTGITPYISMLRQRHHDGLPLCATLVYINRTNVFPFADEIRAFANNDATFSPVLTTNAPSAHAFLQSFTDETPIYIAGPEKKVNALAADFIENGVVQTRIKRDLFTGGD